MELTRRSFLKTASAAAVLGAAAQLPMISGCSSPAANQTAGETSETAVEIAEYKGYCRMCMRDGCCYVAQTKNGVVMNIEGNPEHEGNHGTMCGKGKHAIMHMYNPYRIKAPMKRTNPEKGMDIDPGWQEISWDEAFEIVGSKFKEIRDKDPNELIILSGFGQYDASNSNHVASRFASLYGTGNSIGVSIFCAVHYGTMMTMAMMPTNVSDEKYAKYTLNIGRTSGASQGSANGACRNVVYSREQNGARQLVVEPRLSFEASQGEWVPIKPATDLEFVLGLINVVLFENGNYDVKFLKDDTNAPYLVQDDGFYLRGADNKPLIWDLSDGKAKAFDDATLTDPAIEGEFEVDGKMYRPSFEWVRDSMRDFTPEWAEGICTIPAAKIREIANDLVKSACIGQTITIDGVELPYRPAAVMTNRGLTNHFNGPQADLARTVLNTLLGNIDVPGGTLSAARGAGGAKPNDDGVVKPAGKAALGKPFNWPPIRFDMGEFYPHCHQNPTQAWKTIIEGPETYGMEITPKAMFVCGQNPIASAVHPDLAIEALKKIPFITTFAYHMDEICMMSDVLLPEDTMLEMEAMHRYTGSIESIGPDCMNVDAVQYRNPVPRLYNTMNANEIFHGIIEKLGLLPELNESYSKKTPAIGVELTGENTLDPDKNYTMHEIYERSIREYYDDKDIDWFAKNGLFKDNQGVSESDTYGYKSWHGKTRMQIYFHTQKESGAFLIPHIREVPHDWMGVDIDFLDQLYQGTIHYHPNPVLEPDSEFDMLAFNFKVPMSMMRLASQDHNPWSGDWMQKYNPFYNNIEINPIDAKSKNLKEGDTVVIESRWGKTQGSLHLTETIRPECVGVPGLTGRMVSTLGKDLASRVHWNQIPGQLPGTGTMDPVHCACEATVPVKIYKA